MRLEPLGVWQLSHGMLKQIWILGGGTARKDNSFFRLFGISFHDDKHHLLYNIDSSIFGDTR